MPIVSLIICLSRWFVSQGDPLSLLLFCLVEEVLSKGISQLINTHKIIPMDGPKSFNFPSHVLYVNDIFVLCMANKITINSLMNFLHSYGSTSRKWINTFKGHYFCVDASTIFNIRVINILICNRGSIPFIYLKGSYLKLTFFNLLQIRLELS